MSITDTPKPAVHSLFRPHPGSAETAQDPISQEGPARGQHSRLDVHPRNQAAMADPTGPLWITEGVKKADSLTSRGLCVVALTGVFNWRHNLGTLGDWEDVPIKGREVTICF